MNNLIIAFYKDLQTLSLSDLQLLAKYMGIGASNNLALTIAQEQAKKYKRAHLQEGIDPNMKGFNYEQIKERLGVSTLLNADLSDADLSDANLSDYYLDGANFSRAILTNANLKGSYLTNAKFSSAILNKANLEEAKAMGANFIRANLQKAKLDDIDLTDADLEEANLEGATLNNAKLVDADLYRANLSGAELSGAELDNADLQGADLQGADLSDLSSEKLNLQGAILTEAALLNADLIEADFSGADLSNADLRDTNCNGAKFLDATLREADFTDAYLAAANFTDSTLEGAYLTGAKLNSAILARTNLSDADFSGAELTGADLSGSDLSGVKFIGAILRDVNLQNTTGVRINFSRADLTGADFSGSDLRVIYDDVIDSEQEGDFNDTDSDQEENSDNSDSESVNMNGTADTEEIDIQDLLKEYPTQRAVMDARRMGKITPNQFRELYAITAAGSAAPVVEAEVVPIPAQAQDCTNNIDIFSGDKWSAEYLPQLKIRVPQQSGQDYVLCINDEENLLTWLQDPDHLFLAWYPNKIRLSQNQDLDPTGHGGEGYPKETFYSLPGEYTMYIAGNLEKIVDLIRTAKAQGTELIAHLIYPQKRIGQAGTRFGVSELHGQEPGYPVYVLTLGYDLGPLRDYLKKIHRIKRGNVPLRLKRTNGYLLFSKENRDLVNNIKQAWDSLSDEERKGYEDRAVTATVGYLVEPLKLLEEYRPLELLNRALEYIQQLRAQSQQ